MYFNYDVTKQQTSLVHSCNLTMRRKMTTATWTNNLNERTTNYGTHSLSYMGPKIWSILPLDIKESRTLHEFKNKIKIGTLLAVHAEFVKTMYPGVGYIS